MTSDAPPLTAPRSTTRADARSSGRGGGDGLLHRLHAEWASMCADPTVLCRAEGWGLGVEFASLDDIVAATGWFRSAAERRAAGRLATGDAEVVMTRLVEAARCDELAARVVLQRLLPGLVHRARAWSRRADGTPFALEELLPAAWLVIRTFPVGRRSGPLVPMLLTDATYHAFVRQGRRRATHEPHPSEDFDRWLDECSPNPWDELQDVLRSVTIARRPLLSAADRRLLGLLLSGCGPDEMAARLGVSVRTVTNRRHDLVERLRRALQVEAA